MIKLLFISFLTALFPLFANADTGSYTVVGRAVDSTTKKGVPFVTVTIQDHNNKVIKRLASDGNGYFEFTVKEPTAGSAIVSAIGYGTAKAKFTIKTGTKKTNIGEILLAEASTQIGQVVVQAQRPLIKIEPDKISYNPEADPESQTLNALDMMRKVPLLTVDGNDDIKLKGAGNFKILINGKESPLMTSNAKDVLKGMPASSIKNIEVITNPSSKYSAEGIGGIINIVTTKGGISGFSGNASLRVDNFGGLGGNFFTTAKIGKFAFSVNYGYNEWKRPKSNSYSRSENTTGSDFRSSITEGFSKYNNKNNFASGEFSYEIDSLNLISASFWGYLGYNTGRNFLTTSMYLPQNGSNQLVKQFNNSNDNSGSWGSISGNIDYQRSFKKPDKLLTVSYKLDLSPNSNKYDRVITGILNYDSSRSKSENTASSNENTFQLDFVNPVTPKHQYEVGLKYILRTNPSNIDYYDYAQSSNSWIPDNVRSNDLSYTQNIVAAYVGYLLKLSKISFKTGARIEGAYTNASYKQRNKDMSFNNNLTDVVPYMTLAYNLNETSSIKLAYTQRLQRPGIWYLNPYINDLNPLMISYGNPNLKTEKVNSFDLGYNYFAMKYSMDLSLYSRLNNNAIQSVTTTLPSGVQSQTYQNTGKNNAYGLSFYGSLSPIPTFSISTYGSAEYNEYSGVSPEGVNMQKSGWTNSVGGNLRWTFFKTFTLSGYGGYNSSSINLYGKSSSFTYNGFSLKKDFMDKKLAVTISANNPFKRTQVWEQYTQGPTFSSYSRNEIVLRSFRIAISYRFGKMGQTVKKAARSINNDDVKGGGGKGATGGGDSK